jgi:glycosyltransferase involved in cell wall biosynthesis/ubiquinone/menaquinone biosynthesis C-methylase UbiE
VKRIGVLVVAYNAASTLAPVLDRIPRDFLPRISKIIVNDDFSADATYLVGLGYRQLSPDLPLEVIRHARNLGYGGNQKAGYRWAIEQDLDIVVMLHGDGQYAPELLPEMVAPLERDDCDAVFGSRMLDKGAARRGGMPAYKWIGNRILSVFENKIAGLDLSEWHSGYRAYSVAALKEIPFDRNDDGFAFDTEIIIQLHEAGKRIVEIPIPTYYGDEICYVNGLAYARDVTRDVLRYRAHKIGFGSGDLAFATPEYDLKIGDGTSHQGVVRWLERREPCRVLDLGCADGRLAELLRACGHEVTGVDIRKSEGVGERLDAFFEADLDKGIPAEVGDGYDVVLAADVLEHVRDPLALLEDARRVLSARGSVIASVPNFGHWYPRARVALGRFDYDRRGILDEGHVRFFTRRSIQHLFRRAGFEIRRNKTIGLPIEALNRGGDDNTVPAALGQLEHLAVEAWPTLFAFQFLYEIEPTR